MWNMTSVECPHSVTYSSNTREPYRTITLTLLRIYPILFILVGTAGNLLSVYVVLRSKLRRHSTFIYLAFLSIIDLAVLYTFCVNFILHAWFDLDLQQVSLTACKIYSFSIYFFPQTSAWILTAVSIDRVVALTGGVRKARKIRQTYIILVSIFFILFLLNIQFLFYTNTYVLSLPTQHVDEFDALPSHGSSHASERNGRLVSPSIYRIVDTDRDINVVQCSSEYSNEYQQFYRDVWVYVDAIVNVYLPFTLMFLCSTIIFLSVLRTMRDAHNSNKRLVARNLSTMLLSINAMFVLLTAPIVFYLMFEKSTLASGTHQCDVRWKAKYKMIKLLFIILMNANHTGNILVYCLTGTEFRTQLFHVLHTWRCRQNPNLLHGQCVAQRTGTYNESRRMSAGALNRDSAHNQSQTSKSSSRKQYYRHSPPSTQQKTDMKQVRRSIVFVASRLFHSHARWATMPMRGKQKPNAFCSSLSRAASNHYRRLPAFNAQRDTFVPSCKTNMIVSPNEHRPVTVCSSKRRIKTTRETRSRQATLPNSLDIANKPATANLIRVDMMSLARLCLCRPLLTDDRLTPVPRRSPWPTSERRTLMVLVLSHLKHERNEQLSRAQ